MTANGAWDEGHGWGGVAPPPWAPPGKGSRAGRADKPQLSREAIVAAAVRIADAEGLDAVSMRRIAQEFGTGAASLYAYVANKDELFDLIVDWVIGEAADAWSGVEPTAENWRELLVEGVRRSKDVLVAHRDVAHAFIGRIPFGPNGLRSVEMQLAILRAGGIPDQIAAYASDLLGQYLVAAAIEEGAWRSRFPDLTSKDAVQQMERVSDYLRSLPVDRFPNLVALAGPLMNQETEGFDRFELGLEVIVRGLASFAPAADEATADAPRAAARA